jgi:hypothetical protein
MRTTLTFAGGLTLWMAGTMWMSPVTPAVTDPVIHAAAQDVPTFSKDVAPILYKHCTGCHRPGEIAPMSLLTYGEARPHAKAIRDEVRDGNMPPWHADAPRGSFLNERGLSDAEKDTLLRWASNGAPEGNAKDLPTAPTYENGWVIGKPDVVFEMAEDYKVPAQGTIAYEYFYLPTNFKEAKWIQAVEIRPGNRSVVHHALLMHRAAPDQPRGAAILQLNREQMTLPPSAPGSHPQVRDRNIPGRLLGTYAPGTNPQVFPTGTAVRLEPGGTLELQMHYTANGEAATDRTKVGLIFAKDPSPKFRRAPPRRASTPKSASSTTRSSGASSPTRTSGASGGNTCSSCRMERRKRSSRFRSTTSTGRRTTCSPSR